jgi:hypothetical protein
MKFANMVPKKSIQVRPQVTQKYSEQTKLWIEEIKLHLISHDLNGAVQVLLLADGAERLGESLHVEFPFQVRFGASDNRLSTATSTNSQSQLAQHLGGPAFFLKKMGIGHYFGSGTKKMASLGEVGVGGGKGKKKYDTNLTI